MTKHPDFGILYFYDENPAYKQMADMSIATLRKWHPDWPVEVVRIPSSQTPWWKKAYRTASFWRWHRRRIRAGQDTRVIAQKANIMLNSPFEHTLYLDADTIVLRPLDEIRDMVVSSDVVITPLPWKTYSRNADWQPETWPYMMAGVMGFSNDFTKTYARYVSRFGDAISKLPSQEQFIVSLCCEMESQNLDIRKQTNLQIDVINLKDHLKTDCYPRYGEAIDLRWDKVKDFYIFHYNHDKPSYIEQIKKEILDKNDLITIDRQPFAL